MEIKMKALKEILSNNASVSVAVKNSQARPHCQDPREPPSEAYEACYPPSETTSTAEITPVTHPTEQQLQPSHYLHEAQWHKPTYVSLLNSLI